MRCATMPNSRLLTDTVLLYRRSGRPEWANRRFQGELDYTQSRELLTRLREQDIKSGRFGELIVDGKLVPNGSALPAEGKSATFTFYTSTQEGQGFFRNVDALADQYRPLGRGTLPAQFYLVEEDFHHDGQAEPPDRVRSLIVLTEFITMFAKLADHKHQTEGSGAWTLVFRTRDGLGSLEAEFDRELLDVEIPAVSWKVVEDICKDVQGIHQSEKRWMFKSVMCEFLKDGMSFKEFVARGAEWATTYENNLQTYLSGFSFDEVKRKIADEHARFAEEVSKIFGDITTKVLSLPLSVAIVMILRTQVKGLSDLPLIILLFVVVAFGITWLVQHYLRVVPRVEENIEMVFGRVGRTDTLEQPKEIEHSVKGVMRSLKRETTKLRTTLRIYLYAAWIVPSIAIVMMLC